MKFKALPPKLVTALIILGISVFAADRFLGFVFAKLQNGLQAQRQGLEQQITATTAALPDLQSLAAQLAARRLFLSALDNGIKGLKAELPALVPVAPSGKAPPDAA